MVFQMAIVLPSHSFAAPRALGGKKGNPARAAKLTAREQSKSARKAGLASGEARLTSLTAKPHPPILAIDFAGYPSQDVLALLSEGFK